MTFLRKRKRKQMAAGLGGRDSKDVNMETEINKRNSFCISTTGLKIVKKLKFAVLSPLSNIPK